MTQYGDRVHSSAGCALSRTRTGLPSALRLLITAGIAVVAWLLLGGSPAAAAESEQTEQPARESAGIGVEQLLGALTADLSSRFLGQLVDSDLTNGGDPISAAADEIVQTVPPILDQASALSTGEIGETAQSALTAVNVSIVVGTGGAHPAPDEQPAESQSPDAGDAVSALSLTEAHRILGSPSIGTGAEAATTASGKGSGHQPAPDNSGSPLRPLAVASTAGLHSVDGSGGSGGSGSVPAVFAAAVFFAALLAMRGARPLQVPHIFNFGKKPSVSPD